MNLRASLLAIFVLSICSTCAQAQFDTIINLPENPITPNPSGFSSFSIGNRMGILSNTQLNIDVGGSIGDLFNAGDTSTENSNIEVNILGGVIGSSFNANSGSTVNISGGGFWNFFNANSGSTVNISGGVLGFDFDANSGSTVNISGGTVGNAFDAFPSSTINISGGTVGDLSLIHI